ncbi:MAG TPA: hypothetical protein VGI10_20450 [Polyangiaceae bacterium]|jgi:hypothetical protein
MVTFKILVMAVGAAGLALACGGSTSQSGGSGGPGAFTTGIPSSTPLGSLTPAQATELCQETGQYITNSGGLPIICKLLAVETPLLSGLGGQMPTDMQLQQQCDMQEMQCSSSPPQMSDCSNKQAEPSTCTATVAEYQVCLNQIPSVLNGISANLPACSALTAASATQVIAGLGSLTQPAACTTLNAKCPGAVPLGGSMSSTGSGSAGAGGAGGGGPAPAP